MILVFQLWYHNGMTLLLIISPLIWALVSLTQLKRVMTWRNSQFNPNRFNGRTMPIRYRPVRRRYFIPNLNKNSNQPNLQIQPIPNRIGNRTLRNRRRRQNRNRNRNLNNNNIGNMPNNNMNNNNTNRINFRNKPIPSFNTFRMTSSVNKNQNTVEMKLPIADSLMNLNNGYVVVPVHPLYIGKRLSLAAGQYSKWTFLGGTFIWLPGVGTDDNTNVACTILGTDNPLGQATIYSSIQNNDAYIAPAHDSFAMPIPPYTERMMSVDPNVITDIPALVYLSVSGANSVLQTGTIFFLGKFAFQSPYTGDDFSNYNPTVITITSSNLGFQCNTLLPGGAVGIVQDSTIPSTDVGEFISMPVVGTINTDSLVTYPSHNGINYSCDQVNDQGVIHVYVIIKN
jgi:hypothetical protein